MPATISPACSHPLSGVIQRFFVREATPLEPSGSGCALEGWMAYRGPRGGEGWQNEAGKVRYVKDQPGRRGHDHGSTVAVTPETPANELFQAVRAWKDALTPAQKQMLFSWGGSGLNMRLAQAGRSAEIGQHERKPNQEDLRAWDELLDSAPKFKGEVYRGMSRIPDAVIAQWLGNGEIVLDNDQSSSRTTTEAEGWRGRGMRGMASVLWRVKQQTGALVENATGVYYGDDPQLGGKNESEVILRQGTRYRIADVRYIDDRGQEFPPPNYAEWLRFQKEDELQERAGRIQEAIDRYERNDVIPKVIDEERKRLQGVTAELEAVKAQKGKAELPDNFLPHQHAWGHYVFDLEEIPDEPVGKKVPQIETPEFKRWFGESKVVGDDGAPLVVYHGTSHAGFDEFDPDKSFAGLGAMFFTADPEFASSHDYAPNREGAGVYPVYLRVQNPFDVTRPEDRETLKRKLDELLPGGVYTAVGFRPASSLVDRVSASGSYFGLEDPVLFNAIREAGYDGVVVEENGRRNIAVFDPRQIKSAIGNRGTFDPESRKINESFDETKVKRDKEGQFAKQEGRGASEKSEGQGQREHQDIASPRTPKIETPEFKRWFGKSVIVKNGKPLVLYHGTTSDFDEFDPDKRGLATQSKDAEQGFYFTTDPEVADAFSVNSYTGEHVEGANVKAVYLRVENPAIWDFFGGQANSDDIESAIREAKENGNDGVILKNIRDRGFHQGGRGKNSDHVIVFRPEQIKSAISNRGTYDPQNPKIGESFAREAWIEYDGPRGGEGWENTETGKVAYVKEQPGQKREGKTTEPSGPKVPPKTTPDARDVLTPQQFGDYLKQNADKWFLDQDAIDNEVARYARRGVKEKLEHMQAADYPLKLDSGPVDLRMAGSRETERVRLTPSADDLRKLWLGKLDLDPNDTIFVRHQTSPQWQREFMELGIDTRTAPPDSRLGRLTATDKGFVQSRIDEPGLFVEPNTVSDVGGPYGVILQVKAGQIKPSPESTGLGYKTGLEGLYGAKDAILAGEVIPPENIVGIYDYDHAAGKPIWIPNPRNPNSGKLRVGANGGLEMVEDAGPPEPVAKTDTPEFKAWFGNSQVVDQAGKPLVLYHGTNRSFDAFDPHRQRTARNSQFQGDGFFFTEDPEVAERYADAAVNQSFDRATILREMREQHPGVLADLLENQIDHGFEKGWELTLAKYGLEGKPIQDWPAELEEYGNDINTLADFVEGSRSNEREDDVSDVFAAMSGGGPQGLPEYALDLATKLGLSAPAPALVPVYLRAEKILHTDDPEEAKTARQRGYDAVRYTGPGRVGDAAEWIVFEPDQIKSATGNRGTYERGNPKITETRWRGRVTEPLVFEREFREEDVVRDKEGQFADKPGVGDDELKGFSRAKYANKKMEVRRAKEGGWEFRKIGGTYWIKPNSARAAEIERQFQAHLRKVERGAKATSEEPKSDREAARDGEPWRGGKIRRGQVYNIPTKELQVDPERFQFKIKVNREGVTEELKSVRVWNPDFAGVLGVWRDPADGKTYVVNGHHRAELAHRLGVEELPIRYFEAATAEEARALGALTNIAEGRGTAVDAAKFMRDSGYGLEEFEKRGVSLEGKVSADALVLLDLSDRSFDRVVREQLDTETAVAVARELKSHELQDQLFRVLEKREQEGKDTSLRVIGEMAREMAETPVVKGRQASLFGDIETEDSLFVPRNELKAAVRADLVRQARDFELVANRRRAEAVAGAGNVLNLEQNRQLARDAEQTLAVYNGLANRRGPISDALNAGAARLAEAKSRRQRDAVRRETIEAVRTALSNETLDGRTAGSPDGPGPGIPAAGPGSPAGAADAGRGDPGKARLSRQEVPPGERHVDEPTPDDPQAPWRGGEIKAGRVYNAPVAELQVDPQRFQFKLRTDAQGVTQELKQVRTWNPDFAGVVSVWRDPQDGKTYVVNGHHRYELANRLGVNDLAIRYLDAKDHVEARSKGALINIAEGRGTAVDAAKFLKDTNLKVEDIQERGVSLKGRVAGDATVLAGLSDQAFDRLVRGTLDTDVALAVGRSLQDHGLQDQLFGLLERRDEAGRDTSLRTIGEMAKELEEKHAPRPGQSGKRLFEPDTIDPLFEPRNELKALIQADITREARDFAAVASRRRAEAVADAGNVLNLERNREISDEAERILSIYQTLKNRRGIIADALEAGAAEWSRATTKGQRNAIRQRTLRKVRDAVLREAGEGDAGTGPAVAGRAGPDAAGRGPDAGTRDSGRRDPPTLGLKFAESASAWDADKHPRGEAGKFARKTEAPMPARHRTSAPAAQSIRQAGFDLSKFGTGAGAGSGEPLGIYLSLPGEEGDFEREVKDRGLALSENVDVEIVPGATVLDWDDRERRWADQHEAGRRYIKKKYGIENDDDAELVRRGMSKRARAERPDLAAASEDHLMHTNDQETEIALSRELSALLRERGVDVVQWKDPWQNVRQVSVINPDVLRVRESRHPLARIVALLESRQAPRRYLVRESVVLESNPNWDETKVKRDEGGRFAEQEGRGGKAERDLPPLPDTVTLGPGDEFLKDLKRYQGSDEEEFSTYEVPYKDGIKQLTDEQFDRVKEINREIRNGIRRERTRGWYAEARQNLRTPATELTREVFAARERLKELAQVRRDRDRHGEFFKSMRDAIDREDWRTVGELNDLIDESRSLKIVRNRYGDVLMSDKTPYAGSVWRNMNGREEWLLQKQDEAYWSEDELHAKHEQAVKEAVLAGKPVSDEVLGHYWYSDWMPKERYDAWRMKDMRDRRAERVNSKEALEAFEKLQPEFSRFADEMDRRGIVEKAAEAWRHEESRVRELKAQCEVISNEQTALVKTRTILKQKLDELEAMGPEAATAAGFDIEARRKELQSVKDRQVELAMQGKPLYDELTTRRIAANRQFLEDVMKEMDGLGGMKAELDAKDFPHAQQHADHIAKATEFLGRVASPVLGSIRAKVVPYTNKDQRSRAGGQEMEMAEIAGPVTYIHELGHIIEDQLGLHPQCFGFLVGQVRGLPVEHMGQGYEPDEFAVKDDFRNKYAGKIYPYAATEILSMGLQELYTNPYGFAKESPRHFWFTLAALQGKLR